MQVRQFVDEGLGNSAHLVLSERAGVVALVDPLRDVERYIEAAAVAGVRVSYVVETHVHNDFVTGSRELAARTGARIVASAAAGLEFEHDPVADGEIVAVGDISFTVPATPGHTPEHVSYLARDRGAFDASPVLFSGGSLLVGAVSRTDLLGHEHAAGLGRQLFHSLHEKIMPLPDDVAVYPTSLAAIADVAHPGWRVLAVGVYRLWRDLGYAVGAVLAGLLADLLGVGVAIAAIGLLTFASGLVVLVRMHETLHRPGVSAIEGA